MMRDGIILDSRRKGGAVKGGVKTGGMRKPGKEAEFLFESGYQSAMLTEFSSSAFILASSFSEFLNTD
jgi:hypothetical protein